MIRHTLNSAALVILALMSVLVPPASGQNVRFQSAVDRLDANAMVRVRTATATTQGRFGGTSADGLLLVKGDRTLPAIPLESVDEMWKAGNGAVPGAKVGAVMGGTLLGGFGLLLANGLCESAGGCGSDVVKAGLVAGILGGASGALLGAAIGSMVKRWVPIHR